MVLDMIRNKFGNAWNGGWKMIGRDLQELKHGFENGSEPVRKGLSSISKTCG